MLSDLKLSRNIYLYASIFFSVYVLILDYFLNLQISLGLSYALIMIFSLFQNGKKPIIYTASFLTLLVIIGAFFPSNLSTSLIVFNRIVDSALIWFAGFLIIKFKNLESEKDEKEKQFEETLNAAPTAIYITRKSDSKILYANEASKNFNGYDKHEILEKKGTDIYVDPEDRKVILDAIEKKGYINNYEMMIRRNDGKLLTILSSVKGIRFKNEDAIISVNADITYQKEVEKKFRQLLESTPDSIFIINQTGDIVLANAKAKALFKSDPVDVIGINIENILPGQKELILQTAKDLNSDKPAHKELEVDAIKNDGTTFPVEVTTSILETEEGKLYTVAIRDVTERKEKEKEIIRSRNYYLTLLEEFPALIWRSGLDAKCNYFNQTWLNFTGRTFKEEEGDGWTENVHPDDFERCVKIYLDNFEQRTPFVMEYRMLRHDGEYRWILDHGRPMYDIHGDFTGFIGNCNDITEAKEAETKIKASEKKFHAIFNQTFQFIGLLTPDGILIEANDTALDFAGKNLEDVVGKPFWDTYWWSNSEESQEKLKIAIKDAAQGKLVRYEVNVKGKDAETLIDFSIKPILNENGEIIWLIPEGRDISEIKKAEKALRESEQQLENTLLSAPVPILISSLATGKVIFANKEALRILSVPEEVILSDNQLDLYHKEEEKIAIREAFQKYGIIENAEISLKRYDDQIIDILVSIKKMIFHNEEVAVTAFSDITIQKKTEKKFKDLIESAPDAIIILDQEGRIVIVNEQTEQFFGYSKMELIGHSSDLLIPKRHRNKFEAFISSKFKHPETIIAGETYESKGLKKDKSEFPVEINLGTLDTEDGILISAIIRDISDRHHAQEELHKKHNQLIEAQQVAHIGSWEWDIENNELNWSDELYRIYGMAHDGHDITFDEFMKNIHPEDRDYVTLIIQKAIEDHQPFNFYHRIIRNNNEIRILNSRGKVIVLNKKPAKLLGTGMDVTDLKLAEEKIRESEEKFRYFVETSNDLIWSLDSEYRWNYLNPQACIEIYGYIPEEMIGKKFNDFQLSKDEDDNFLSKLFEQGATFHYETVHKRKDGNSVCLKFNGVLLKDEKDKIIGATGTATDISELKKAEENLRQTESALRSLHDITTGEDTLDTDEKIDALLKLGCDRFKMDNAYLVQIIEDEAKVIASSTMNDDVDVNDMVLDMDFHKSTIKEKEPILVKEISNSNFKNDKLFKEYNVNSFISEKIVISGNVFGTICFISTTKRNNEFNPTDSEIIKLMAQWVGGVIQREQVKQNLMNAIVETEEQERKRFAEDLHDSLGQILSAAKLNLSAMESKVKDMDNGMIDFYENSKSLVDYAMQEAKAISQNLMPAALENYGLEKTIETLCEKISYTNKVKINFHSFNMTNRFRPNIEIGIYRIAQELINNSVKHSNAEEINIQLIQHKKSILLMVEDDGEGFEEIQPTVITGMGLKNVQTRVKSLHGTFSIDTSPGNGTIATVEIPLNE